MRFPKWAEELKIRYLSGEASLFLLHGNVHDLYAWESKTDGGGTELKYLDIETYLTNFLQRTKDFVLYYNISDGLQVRSGKESKLLGLINAQGEKSGKRKLLDLPKNTSKVLAFLEEAIVHSDTTSAVIVDYLETIIPQGSLTFLSEDQKSDLIRIQRWTSNRSLLDSDNIVVMITESLSDIPRRLLASPQLAVLEIERPNREERLEFVEAELEDGVRFDPKMTQERFAEIGAGLSLVQIKALMKRAVQTEKELSFSMVNKRKKAIIEQECHGLVEFVAPEHDFSHVGGMEELKQELMQIASSIRAGKKRLVPMGMLFVGPMGTGKTFVAEAFAGESGLTCIKFKNFRDKWVGSTEGNLEKILQVVKSLGYVLLIIDEADRSMSGNDGDGGTSSRVIARIKEFMSDTSHRGRIVVLMMTNRPDKIDIDLKRPGRLDYKVPFFFPQDIETTTSILNALVRKNKLQVAEGLDMVEFADKLEGYSGAELEAVLLRAMRLMSERDAQALEAQDIELAVEDVIPSRDQRMLEFMELLAVFESSTREMLPLKYKEMTNQEVLEQLDALRIQLRSEYRT
ncbi:MAG: hypothetical protein CMK59_04925 [Proteobacteria bacterium]|nr:hypothetical protein [Pseudomonadota bacterium]